MKRSSRRPGSWAISLSFCGLMVFMVSSLALPQRVWEASTPQPSALTLPSGVTRVTSVEGIDEYRLANGLRVLLLADPSKPRITVDITYLVGSRFEGYGETGMAHLLEHLMFKGTPTNPNIPQEISAHGAEANASTSYDRTNYFEIFAATEANLKWALNLEADRMIHSYIAKKDLDSEMTVVRNEYEKGENSPMNILTERSMESAYLWHNYGHPTIGARSDIENVPIRRLQAFYHKFYQPDNAYLMVSGEMNEGKTLDLINDVFSKIPKPTRQLQKLYTVEPTQDGERAVTLRRVGEGQIVLAAFHIPAGSSPQFPAVDVLTQILSNAPSGPLYKALVLSKKATSVFGEDYQLHDPAVVLFGAEVPPGASLKDARDTLLKTLEAFSQTPPSEEDLERARSSLMKRIDQTLDSTSYLTLALTEYIGMGDWRLFFKDRDDLKTVTAEEVQQAAADYLKTSNCTVGMFIPTAKPNRSEIPPAQDIAAMLRNYKGEKVVDRGAAFDPTPANIEAHTRRIDLPGGIQLALLSKKTRGERVDAEVQLRFGTPDSLKNTAVQSDFASSMLMRGTRKHTREQLQDELNRLKASLRISQAPGRVTVSLQTVRENLPAVLKLAAEVLREPSFPESEYEILQRASISAVEQRETDPQAVAENLFQRHLYPYAKDDPRYVATPEEQIKEIRGLTVDEVKDFYTKFYGASHAEMAIVGDFDEATIPGVVKSLLGDWKSASPFERLAKVYHAAPAIDRSLEIPDKANAFFVAGMQLKLRDDSPDYPALALANYMLGGGFLNSRLAMRIRQKEGLSYGVGSQLSASSLDPQGAFTAYAIYAPQNVTRLETAFKEVIAQALKDGFTVKEVADAKSGYLQSRKVERTNDFRIAGSLASYLYLHRTFQWDARFEERIAALTPQQILEVLRRYIDPSQITMIKAGTFAKAGAAPTVK